MEIILQDLMISSGVKFGTSGARGLADDMTDFVCYVYTKVICVQARIELCRLFDEPLMIWGTLR
jgi:hypothetical protein